MKTTVAPVHFRSSDPPARPFPLEEQSRPTCDKKSLRREFPCPADARRFRKRLFSCRLEILTAGGQTIIFPAAKSHRQFPRLPSRRENLGATRCRMNWHHAIAAVEMKRQARRLFRRA